MMSLWNEQTVAEATGGEARGHFHASRVEIDSRRIQLGDLFVAIKGDRLDGHLYVAESLARGAVAAIVSEIPVGLPQTASLIIVKDTLEALVAMGKYNRARSKAKIVGVTGSVGKTSAKEMLRLALATHGKTYATTGNFNNHIGTPLNLANLPLDAKFGVFEMGMNHEGEIRYLTQMVKPHVSLITNIEAVHLEYFKNLDGIADAKAEIFEGMEKGAVAVLNADNSYDEYLTKKAEAKGLVVKTYGEKGKAKLLSYQPTANGAEIQGAIAGQTISFTLGAVGKHFAGAAIAALAVADTLSLPLPKTAAALADYREPEGRGQTVKLPLANGGYAWLIDDAYNASPASTRAAIAKTDEIWQREGKKGRKIAALGDMLELGPNAPHLHASLSDVLLTHGFHHVLTAGPLMKHLEGALSKEMRGPHVQNAAQLLPLLQKTLSKDDVVLVKGSHGSKMYEISSQLAVSSCQKAKNF